MWRQTRIGLGLGVGFEAYVDFCVANQLVGNVAAAISDGFSSEVGVGIPASFGGVCIAGSGGRMLNSGCRDNPHWLPLNTQSGHVDDYIF